MQRRVFAVRALPFVLLVFATSCVPQYAPPQANEPHAILKFRRTYEITRGASLRELVLLDEHRAYGEMSAAGAASQPRTDSILAHPGPVTAQIATEFFHQEMRTVQEQYTVYEQRMTMETYSCSSGASYRSCTRSVSHSYPVTKTRYVTKPVDVTDGGCASRVSFGPQDGHVYLLQYTYRDHGVCNVQCVEQIPTASPGEFRNERCPVVATPDK